MALTFTTDDLDRLKEAYLTGATKVKIGDREVEYRSQAQLLEAIKAVQSAIDGVSDDVDDNPSVIQSSFSKGES